MKGAVGFHYTGGVAFMERRLHKNEHKHSLCNINIVYVHKNEHKHSFSSFLCKRRRSHCSETRLNITQINSRQITSLFLVKAREN